MVHGGLRYIAMGDIKLTRHPWLNVSVCCVKHRGLVDRMSYFLPITKVAESKVTVGHLRFY